MTNETNTAIVNETEMKAKVKVPNMQERKAVLVAAFITKIDEKLVGCKNTSNIRKLEKHKLFFERNDAALTLLARDHGDANYIADQIYAIDKLVDALRIAVAGHMNLAKISLMNHFIMRTLVSFQRLQNAGATIDVNNVINCAIQADIQPLGEHASIVMRSDGHRSNAGAQRPQVINALRVMRILKDNDKVIDLNTNIAKALLAVLVNYDGKELASTASA